MRSVALLIFVCLAAVSTHTLSIEEQPTVPMPEACRGQANPLLRTLTTSLHNQRHQVHVRCRARLHTERERHRQEKANLLRSREHCKMVASALPNRKTAADLIQQCEDTVSHLLQDHAYVQAIDRVRSSCRYMLREVNVRVHDNTVRLMELLTQCSHPHACFIYNLVKRSILTNVDQIHSGVTGDVQRICRRPNLPHDIRRSCERFNLTGSILVDFQSVLSRRLHQSLSAFCARPVTPLHEVRTEVQTPPHKVRTEVQTPPRKVRTEVQTPPREVRTEVQTPPHEVRTEVQTPHEEQTAPKEDVATTEPIVTEEEMPEEVAVTTESQVVKARPAVEETSPPAIKKTQAAAIKTAEHEPEAVTGAAEEDGLSGWNGIVEGVGPVLNHLREVAKAANDDKEVDLSKVKSPQENLNVNAQPHHHHKHHSHRSLTIGMIAAVGVLCLIVAVLSAALTVTYLRRRRAYRPVAGDREAKMPLTDDDQLNTIKSKGYENPTYVFFEGTEE